MKTAFARWITVTRLGSGIGALVPVLLACGSHDLLAPTPNVVLQAPDYTTLDSRRELDLIFMVDNSLSMEQEQANLAQNFPAFIGALDGIRGGLPDVRIAVISSDVGAGGVTAGTCRGLGDGGRFSINQVITEGQVSRMTDVNCGLQEGARWIAASAGGAVTNLAPGKTLPQVFGCMAQRGVGFCGYEHQLESVRRAIAPEPGVNPENVGFLRKDAFLGIVLITDEDDCSAPSDAAAFFDPDIAGQEGSYRCATEGHLCDGQAPPASGDFSVPLASCRANPGGRLRKVRELVDAVKATKPGREDRILVAAIAGWPVRGQESAATYDTVLSARGRWDLKHVCESKNKERATPALRINEFVSAFGNNGVMESICQEELAPALRTIGERLAKIIEPPPCVEEPLADANPTLEGVQPGCVLTEERTVDGKTVANSIPPCQGARGRPCFTMEHDLTCAGGWKHVVDRGGAEPPTEARLVLKCLTCASPATPGCR